ncbi:hypothetical protein GCM10019060_25970 [Novosphingobium pokkalii]|nr:hypothetical protein GCM10019060_25970 [Novosphingobium pokkalii]
MSCTGDGVAEFSARIATIGEDMTQPGKPPPRGFQEVNRAIAVLNISCVDLDGDEEAAGVGQDMPLAPLDFLARVIAARATTFGGLHGLTVDHTGTGACLAAFDLA